MYPVSTKFLMKFSVCITQNYSIDLLSFLFSQCC
jgi:hypothetical protein